jgi:glutamyl-tRNA reductase
MVSWLLNKTTKPYLAAIAEESLAQREAEAAKGHAIVAERTAALWPQVAHSLNQQG